MKVKPKRGGRSALTSSVAEAQDKAAQRIANRTRNLKNEQYRIINENGEVVLEKRGEHHEVRHTVGESRQYLPGAIDIHNHPDGGPPSLPDLRSFGYGARAIYIAAPEGNYILINGRYDKRDRYEGWDNMSQEIQRRGLEERVKSDLEVRREGRETPKAKRLQDRMTAISSKWSQARSNGESKEKLDEYIAQYDKVSNEYKAYLDKFVKEYDYTKEWKDFYKSEAKKYGFIYKFIPKTR